MPATTRLLVRTVMATCPLPTSSFVFTPLLPVMAVVALAGPVRPRRPTDTPEMPTPTLGLAMPPAVSYVIAVAFQGFRLTMPPRPLVVRRKSKARAVPSPLIAYRRKAAMPPLTAFYATDHIPFEVAVLAHTCTFHGLTVPKTFSVVVQVTSTRLRQRPRLRLTLQYAPTLL